MIQGRGGGGGQCGGGGALLPPAGPDGGHPSQPHVCVSTQNNTQFNIQFSQYWAHFRK